MLDVMYGRTASTWAVPVAQRLVACAGAAETAGAVTGFDRPLNADEITLLVAESISRDTARLMRGLAIGLRDADEEVRTILVSLSVVAPKSKPEFGDLLSKLPEKFRRAAAAVVRGVLLSAPGGDAEPIEAAFDVLKHTEGHEMPLVPLLGSLNLFLRDARPALVFTPDGAQRGYECPSLWHACCAQLAEWLVGREGDLCR